MRIIDNLSNIILFSSVLSAAVIASAPAQGQNFPMLGAGSAELHASTSTSTSAKPIKTLHAVLHRPQQSLAEIAIELVNPINSLQSLSSEYLYEPHQGELPTADRQTLRSIAFTGSFPFHLSNGKNMVLRTTIPVNLTLPTYRDMGDPRDFTYWRIRQEADTIAPSGNFSSVHAHMYDISYDVAYGGVNDHGLITMVGVAGVLPTSEDGSGGRHLYLLGPEIAVGKKFERGIVGGWLKHLTNVAGTSPGIEYNSNLTELKLFFAHGMGSGWQILSNSNITYDWEGAKHNKLLLPLGGGIAKTMRIGSLPVRFVLEAQKYLETPDAFGPDWSLKFSMAFVDIKHSRF